MLTLNCLNLVFCSFLRCNTRWAPVVYRLIGEALIGIFFHHPFLIKNSNFSHMYLIWHARQLRVNMPYFQKRETLNEVLYNHSIASIAPILIYIYIYIFLVKWLSSALTLFNLIIVTACSSSEHLSNIKNLIFVFKSKFSAMMESCSDKLQGTVQYCTENHLQRYKTFLSLQSPCK